MQLFKRTPDSFFQKVENFDYKTQYIYELVDFNDDYKDFRLAYIDENHDGEVEHYFLYTVTQRGVIYGDT